MHQASEDGVVTADFESEASMGELDSGSCRQQTTTSNLEASHRAYRECAETPTRRTLDACRDSGFVQSILCELRLVGCTSRGRGWRMNRGCRSAPVRRPFGARSAPSACAAAAKLNARARRGCLPPLAAGTGDLRPRSRLTAVLGDQSSDVVDRLLRARAGHGSTAAGLQLRYACLARELLTEPKPVRRAASPPLCGGRAAARSCVKRPDLLDN